MQKGTIALDIDGTITNREHRIPGEVIAYFETLHEEGWQLIFVTGRAFSFAAWTLSTLPFPFLLGVQNGADLLEMPSKKRVGRAYLGMETIEKLEKKCEEGDFIVYAGLDHGDLCYYRPDRFSEEMRAYLKKVEAFSDAPWKPVETFQMEEQDAFPLIKYIGTKEALERFQKELEEIPEIKTSLIKDPIDPSLHLILITSIEADKGKAALTFMEKYQLRRPLIVGGDDNNDLPLLKVGDVRIKMKGAPDMLKPYADITAPPSEQMGIIQGLKEGIKRCMK
ncbi:MAG: HAD family phosphatase [Chlamydiia bacterium]|nr:HAD family phosphatase [Chlamydiia bacterium]